MTGDEEQLADYLSKNDIISGEVLDHLIELRNKLNSSGTDTSLGQLLVKNNFLTQQKLEGIKETLESEPSPESTDEPDTSDRPSPSSPSESESDASRPSPSRPSGSKNESDRSSSKPESKRPSSSQRKQKKPSSSEAPRAERRTKELENRDVDQPDTEDTGSSIFSKVASEEGKTPEPVPGYKVTDVLGKGGTGAVFEVQEKKSGEKRALKLLYPKHLDEPSFVKRFKREGRLLTEFDHPNIVAGYDYGNHEHLFYQVLELIDGTSILDRIMKDGPFEEEIALDIIVQIAEALKYLQEQGIVHRDIKPDNVMLLDDGTIRILDLGFAKEIGADPDVEEGTTLGTVYYMSPEQAKGQQELDIRSDIYSLGVTLYHMVFGDVPFEGNEPREIMAKQVREHLKGQKVKSGRISTHLHYLIEKMMSKEKDFRFQNPGEIIDEITGFLQAQERFEFEPDETDLNPFT